MVRASDQAAIREYYTPNVPEYIELSDHLFVNKEMCEWVRLEIALNSSVVVVCVEVSRILTTIHRSSATVIADMYNRTLSKRWSTNDSETGVSYRIILECFFLYSLLLDCRGEGTPLALPHNVHQTHRLLSALDSRNSKIAEQGLTHWHHRCKMCFKTITNEETGENGKSTKANSRYVSDFCYSNRFGSDNGRGHSRSPVL